jgi:hypothetical protein
VKLPGRKSTRVLFFAVILVATLVTAQSAVLTVTNTQDSGPGSLRDTIAAAANGDTIQFDAALNGQAITLTSAELLIDKSLTINGPGANQLSVQRSATNGTPLFRIFNTSGDHNVTLAGLTITNGNTPDGGGGISCTGYQVTITKCVVSGNSAGYGGGIYRSLFGLGGASVNVIDSMISDNRAGTGGAIYVAGHSYGMAPGAWLGMTNSTVLGNVATSRGGGVYVGGYATITSSALSANVATMDVSGGGGGIYNDGTLTIANSTLSGNSASLGGGVRSSGAGNPLYPGMLTITNSTISSNSAGEGGGLRLSSYSAQRFKSTIVALNTSTNSPDVKGELTSDGFNLIGNNSGTNVLSPQASDQIGTPAAPIDPLLGPLQDNGGPTFTHALLLGSPAIDKGDSSGTTTDQRGFGRRKDIPALSNATGGDGADIGAVESAFAKLANISTRLQVQTGDNAMIGGFIITGTQQKTVIVRGIGPSLPLAGALADPFVEVYGSSGEFLATNDNWRDATTRTEIEASGLAPTNDLEPALWGVLNPGAYTVVVRGKNNTTGIGLFEVYDLDQTVESNLGNISTRGLVRTGDDVMIGGTIIAGAVPARVLFRAIGPSLANFGVSNALGDPVLQLHDGNGELIAINYDWGDTQEAEISATGLAPSNNLESAILRDLAPGAYTAIVRGLNETTGVALVEVYNLN